MTFYIKKSQDYVHYNRALGEHISSKRDYQEKMKRAGCEPYNPAAIKKGNKRSYQPSKWAREVARAGTEQMRRDGRVSGVVMKELVEKGNMKPTPQQIKDLKTGGSYASED